MLLRAQVVIPKTLAPGKYVVRFELLALHSAQSAGGAQFYPNCADVTVTGSGTTALPKGVSIPGFYKSDTPGVIWCASLSSFPASITFTDILPSAGTCVGSPARVLSLPLPVLTPSIFFAPPPRLLLLPLGSFSPFVDLLLGHAGRHR